MTRQGELDLDPARWPDPAAMNQQLHSMGITTLLSVWPHFSPGTRYYDMLHEQGMADPFRRWHAGFWRLQRCDWPQHRHHQPRRSQVVVGGHPGSIHQARPFRLHLARRNRTRYRSCEGRLLRRIGSCAITTSIPCSTRLLCTKDSGATSATAGGSFILARAAYLGAQRNGTVFWSSDILLDVGHAEALHPCRVGLYSHRHALLGYRYRRLLLSCPPCILSSAAHAVGRSFRCTWQRSATTSTIPSCLCGGFNGEPSSPSCAPTARGSTTRSGPTANRLRPILAKYLRLRYQLLPYTYSLAYGSYQTGAPFMRALFMDFPERSECRRHRR